MNNIKLALMKLQSCVVFIPDSEIQVEVEAAIKDLQKELHDKAEAPDASDEICYRCKHMCGMRRRYVGGVMLKCVKFESVTEK